MAHLFFLFDGILFDARSIHVLCSHHNNRCKQFVPRFPLYMMWDLILTSYTINSLPVCCSTNKLLKTWLGKAKFFCIRFNSKTKQKPVTKMQDHVFLLHWRPHAKIQALSQVFFFHPDCHLAWFCTHPFNCLQPGSILHNSGTWTAPRCSVDGCGRRHHQLLHIPEKSKPN